MTSPDSPDSLVAALAAVRVPAENHSFIQRFTSRVGVIEYRAVPSPDKPYIRAVRGDGLPDLHIYYGYTNGFTSETEILNAAGDGAGRGRSSRKGTWYVEHPTNRMSHGHEGRSRDKRREAGFCQCGMQLSVTGICGSCD